MELTSNKWSNKNKQRSWWDKGGEGYDMYDDGVNVICCMMGQYIQKIDDPRDMHMATPTCNVIPLKFEYVTIPP